MNYNDKNEFYKNNRANVCHKCERADHYARDCKVKDKIKSLDLYDNIMDSLCNILHNSPSKHSTPNNSGREESSTSEYLKDLQEKDYLSSYKE